MRCVCVCEARLLSVHAALGPSDVLSFPFLREHLRLALLSHHRCSFRFIASAPTPLQQIKRGVPPQAGAKVEQHRALDYCFFFFL